MNFDDKALAGAGALEEWEDISRFTLRRSLVCRHAVSSSAVQSVFRTLLSVASGKTWIPAGRNPSANSLAIISFGINDQSI